MRRMLSTVWMPAIFLIVMSTLSPAKDKQDGGKDAPKGGAPVTQADLEARVKLLEKVVADQQEELIRLGRFADGVAVGIGRLAVAGEASREHGFEAAGPNPAARTDLLEGIKSLHDAVQKSFEKPDEKAADGKEKPAEKR
jgi:hypothetical protein